MTTAPRARKRDPEEAQPTTPEEQLSELGEVFASAGPGASLYLFRTHPRPPGARQEAYLETFDRPPTFQEVRETYGGGSYRLRVLDSGKRTKHSVGFSIEGAPIFQSAAFADPAGIPAEESRLDRLERLVEALIESRDGGADQAEDDREFKKMMNRAIMARSIAEATSANASPIGHLKDLLGILAMLREEAGGRGAVEPAEDMPWWASLAERLFDQMDRAPRPAAPAPAPVSAPAPAVLPPRAASDGLDAFLATLARALESGATVEALEALVPGDLQGIETVPEHVWAEVVRKNATRWPVFATMPARAKCAELLRRLKARALQSQAPAQNEPGEQTEQHD